MNLLFDNTTMHQIGRLLDKDRLTVPECIHALRLAEQIMFSDSVITCAFDREPVIQITIDVVRRLEARGNRCGKPIFTVSSFGLAEYISACDSACIDLQAELQGKSPIAIRALGKLVSVSSRPNGVAKMPLARWIDDEASCRNRHLEAPWEYLETERAFGVFDYMMATNQRLRGQVVRLVKGNEAQRQLALKGLTILFRGAVNKRLAGLRNSHYAPSTSRAAILSAHATDVRDLLSRSITSNELRADLAGASHPIDIGLPICALFALQDKMPETPLDFLDCAYELRSDSNVTSMRNWLARLSSNISDGKEYNINLAQFRIHDLERQAREALKQPQNFYHSLFTTISRPILDRISSWDPKISGLASDLYDILHAVQSARRRLFISKVIALGEKSTPAKVAFFRIFNKILD